MTQPFRSATAALTLSTTWASGLLGAQESDGSTEVLPSRGWLGGLDVSLLDLSGANSVRFFLSSDLAGYELLSPHGTSFANQTINLSIDDVSKGGVSWDLVRKPFVGPIYVHLRLDAGSATAIARLSGEADSSCRAAT